MKYDWRKSNKLNLRNVKRVNKINKRIDKSKKSLRKNIHRCINIRNLPAVKINSSEQRNEN